MKVRINEIAQELNLSRNTVSKVLNNTGTVSPETTKRVIEKAQEMGYTRIVMAPANNIQHQEKTRIAVFTREIPTKSHFGALTLLGFENIISGQGYTLDFYVVKSQAISDLVLPANFDISKTAAIVCIELFDLAYSQMICNLGIPKLFIDAPVGLSESNFMPDIVLMENFQSTTFIVNHMLSQGIKRFGFIGDIKHCKSFAERWMACKSATAIAGIMDVEDYSILVEDQPAYRNPSWLAERISELKELPEVFICANDFIALTALHSLKMLNLSTPHHIKVTGFDDTPESQISNPTLTTAHISGNKIGSAAAEMLLSKINNPDLPSRLTYISTQPIFRESTND